MGSEDVKVMAMNMYKYKERLRLAFDAFCSVCSSLEVVGALGLTLSSGIPG